jgi:hypothetical protein
MVATVPIDGISVIHEATTKMDGPMSPRRRSFQVRCYDEYYQLRSSLNSLTYGFVAHQSREAILKTKRITAMCQVLQIAGTFLIFHKSDYP